MSKGWNKQIRSGSFKRLRVISSYIVGADEPGHLRGRGQLPVDEALDLGLAPAAVDVDDGEHEPLAGLELVLDAVLVALPLHLHGRQDEAVADEVGGVPHALGRLEARKEFE